MTELDQRLQLAMAFMLASSNLALSWSCVAKEFRKRLPLSLVYWGASIYFVGVPLFADALAFVVGMGETWSSWLAGVNINYSYRIDEMTLLRTTAFVFLFNLLFAMVHGGATIRDNVIDTEGHEHDRFLIMLFIFSGFLGLALFGHLYGFSFTLRSISFWVGRTGGALSGLYSILITLGSTGAFYAVRQSHGVLLFLVSFPSVLISAVTAQRPHLIPVVVCALYGYLERTRVLDRRRLLFRIVLLGYLSVTIMLSVRMGFSGALDFLMSNPPYPINRDSSSDMLYFCFSEGGLLRAPGTQFSGIQRLLLTGIQNRTLFGVNQGDVDVTKYIAYHRFGWTSGTLHPTLYGWLFTDMRWYGLLLAVYIGLILSVLERLSFRHVLLRVIYISATSLFIVVSMRGSVQFAYSKLVYSLVLGSIAFFAIHILASVGRQRAVNGAPNYD